MQVENELIIAQKEKDLEKFKQSKEMDMEKQVFIFVTDVYCVKFLLRVHRTMSLLRSV